MDLNPARRYTAGELLEHPWLRGELPQRPPQPSAQWAAGPEATGARPSSVGAGGTQSTDGSTDGADGGS